MDYIQQFIGLVDGTRLSLVVALVLANFVTGVAVSIKKKDFKLKEMGGFLLTRVLPYLVGYFGVGILAVVEDSWSWAITAVWVIIIATLAGAILQNLKELGVSIPGALRGRDE